MLYASLRILVFSAELKEAVFLILAKVIPAYSASNSAWRKKNSKTARKIHKRLAGILWHATVRQ